MSLKATAISASGFPLPVSLAISIARPAEHCSEQLHWALIPEAVGLSDAQS